MIGMRIEMSMEGSIISPFAGMLFSLLITSLASTAARGFFSREISASCSSILYSSLSSRSWRGCAFSGVKWSRFSRELHCSARESTH